MHKVGPCTLNTRLQFDVAPPGVPEAGECQIIRRNTASTPVHGGRHVEGGAARDTSQLSVWVRDHPTGGAGRGGADSRPHAIDRGEDCVYGMVRMDVLAQNKSVRVSWRK